MQIKVNLEEAQGLILQHTRTLNAEYISVLNALGRVSAADFYAPEDLPGRAQSAVFGCALAGLADAYQLTGTVKPGEVPLPIESGQAVKVTTGGNLPIGTMAVIPHEKVLLENNCLYPLQKVKAGENIKEIGEDSSRGSRLLCRGTIIGAGEISLLAAFGITNIEVFRQPRAAVLCLSQNIVSWSSAPEPGQIRDSNGPLLASLITGDGGIPVKFLTAGPGDDLPVKMTEELLQHADILITTGGTYADGDNKACLIMKELGAEILYWDVPVQPGSHTGASIHDNRLIISLSGNPAACAVGYHLFAAPALRVMQGFEPGPQSINAVCINGFPKKSGSRRFVRGHLSWNEVGWQVEVLPGQKPSMIRSLIGCNALIDIPADSPAIAAGSEVSVIALGIKTGFLESDKN